MYSQLVDLQLVFKFGSPKRWSLRREMRALVVVVAVAATAAARRRRAGLQASSAACWKVAPQRGRLKENVGHQGEELTYRIVAAALSRRAPRVVWWPWPALPWSRDVLNATLPGVRFVGEGAPEPAECGGDARTITPEYRAPQWRLAGSHAKARRAARDACGVAPRRDYDGAVVVRVLERTDAADAVHRGAKRVELCGGRPVDRRVRDVDFIRGLAARAAAAAGRRVDFKVDAVPNDDPGDLCAQLRRFANVDVLVSIHGAHLVNAPWMDAGSLLLEVLPYAHKKKRHHSRLLVDTDIHYDKLCGVRPDASLPAREAACEGRTAAARDCTARARDCFATPLRGADDAACAGAAAESCECPGRVERRLAALFRKGRPVTT